MSNTDQISGWNIILYIVSIHGKLVGLTIAYFLYLFVTVRLEDVLPSWSHLVDPRVGAYSLGPEGEHQTEPS
jgi:hypothetical protein